MEDGGGDGWLWVVLKGSGEENELKAARGPSFEERRSVDEPEVILRVNRVSIQMRQIS